MAVSVGATYSESLHDLWEPGLIYKCVPHIQQYGCTMGAQQTMWEGGPEQGAAPGVAWHTLEESCSLGYHVCDLKTLHNWRLGKSYWNLVPMVAALWGRGWRKFGSRGPRVTEFP